MNEQKIVNLSVNLARPKRPSSLTLAPKLFLYDRCFYIKFYNGNLSSYADTWSLSNNCLIQGELFSHFSLTHGKLFCMSCDKQIIPISLSLFFSLSPHPPSICLLSFLLSLYHSFYLSSYLFQIPFIYSLSPPLYQNVFVLKIVIFLCHGLSQK